jgi:hypothetical protein
MWSGHELAAAARTPDPRIARAVVTADRHGIAEQLAAGPDLARELRDGWDTHARGAALVTAAVDLRRAGCHRPAPLDALRALHESYVRPGSRPESWDAALDWATEPLHGTSSLLEPVDDGYLAFDYLLHSTEPVPDVAWDAIVEFASPVELLEVAPAAAADGKHGHLRAALAKALAHKEFAIAAELVNLLGEVGFDAEAAELLTEIAAEAAGAVAAEDLIRIRRRRIKWEVTADRGDPNRVLALAQELVRDCTDLLGPTAVETYRARVALTRSTPDPAEALLAARALLADVITHLGPDHYVTQLAFLAEAFFARHVEGPRTAVRLYYNLLEYETVGDSKLYIDAQWRLGSSLLEAGEARSAVEVLEVAVENAQLHYGADHGMTFEIRLTRILALDGDGRSNEALDLAERLAQDSERVLGRDHPTAADARFAVEQLTARTAN